MKLFAMWMVVGLVVMGIFPAVWLGRGAVTPGNKPAAENEQKLARFVAVEVFVDTGAKHLGAYQIEVTAKDTVIVGLEGGEKPFNAAPFYDPAALRGGRIVVAAFSTDDTLPKGLTRVARLHMEVSGDLAEGLPVMTEKLTVVTDELGNDLQGKVVLRPMQGELR